MDPRSKRAWRVELVAAAVPAVILAGAMSGCATHDGPALSGYTCCNFHYEKLGAGRQNAIRYWISDANWSSLPRISAGTPIRTKTYAEHHITVDVDLIYTQEMTLGLDYGRSQDIDDWARKMIVQDDPRLRIAGWPEPVRRAVGAGKVAIGMTKEQVIVSLGYPPAHETPSLYADQWKYWYGKLDTFLVVWDAEGRVRDVVAEPQNRSAVMP